VLESAEDFDAALHELVCEAFTNHQRILFDGNGYSEEWKLEAVHRGLSNLSSTAKCLPTYVSQKNIELVERHGIFTETELRARYAIYLESYNKIVNIEARTMVDMAVHQIMPAAMDYTGDMCKALIKKQQLDLPCRAEQTMVKKLSSTIDDLYDRIEALQNVLGNVPKDAKNASVYYHTTVIPAMDALRESADILEQVTAKSYWPYPTYADLLFY